MVPSSEINKTNQLYPRHTGGAVPLWCLYGIRKPQWHRHDRRGSAVVPSLIAVAPRKTDKPAVLRGGTADTLNMFKTSAVHRGLGQSAVGSPRHRHYRSGTAMTAVAPYKDRSNTSIADVPPQYNRRAIAEK